MYWEEKVDRLKKEFSSSDFGIPFTEWQDIFKKIEANFIIKNNSNFQHTNWSGCIKHKNLIKQTSTRTLSSELDKLDRDKNYWAVLTIGTQPTAKQLIYDCKPTVISRLAMLSGADFYIVDKKYAWLSYFHIDNDKQEIEIYKSVDGVTPFDE